MGLFFVLVVLTDTEKLQRSPPTTLKRESKGKMKNCVGKIADIVDGCDYAIEENVEHKLKIRSP